MAEKNENNKDSQKGQSHQKNIKKRSTILYKRCKFQKIMHEILKHRPHFCKKRQRRFFQQKIIAKKYKLIIWTPRSKWNLVTLLKNPSRVSHI